MSDHYPIEFLMQSSQHSSGSRRVRFRPLDMLDIYNFMWSLISSLDKTEQLMLCYIILLLNVDN